ncbi:MAG TPA: thiaminase II [Nocardioidaceae bacterium]|nr:thiaminase II [Nocardioidaceae bacterium]
MTATAPSPPLTGELWSRSKETFEAILAHPFLTGLTSGELTREQFAHYVVQDAHYLRGYAKALSTLAGRAGAEDTTAMFAAHAANAIAVERSMHAEVLTELGLDPNQPPEAGPTTVAYRSYLLAAVHGTSFLEGVGAVLPCYWIYWEVGKALSDRASPDPLYARWIRTYSGEEFGTVVQQALELTDRLGVTASAAERTQASESYQVATRYEWMFWDAAHRLETWPL